MLTYRTCEVVDCDRQYRCSGMCSLHYSRLMYYKNRDRALAAKRQYYLEHIDERKAYEARYRSDPEVRERKRQSTAAWTAVSPRRKFDSDLRAKFNVSADDWDLIFAAQGDGCAGCGKLRDHDRRLSVDHDHRCCPAGGSCGKCVRGLLCRDCNRGIGCFLDDPARLRRMADYLEQGGVRWRDSVTAN